jgi:hypothetical protein
VREKWCFVNNLECVWWKAKFCMSDEETCWFFPVAKVLWLKPHSKPGPFDKQFCMANTAFFISYTTFQSLNKEIFYSRQMWLYEILISTSRQDKNFNFVSYLFSSPTSAYAKNFNFVSYLFSSPTSAYAFPNTI